MTTKTEGGVVMRITQYTRKLVSIQQRDGSNDDDFAKKLGITRPHWNGIKNGRFPISDSVKKRAAGLWPTDLADLYLKEALESAEEKEAVNGK